MGLFGKKTEGGLMDVIRCDQQQYLVWKWSPSEVHSKKENAICFGSSLRVKAGEVAVFVYKQRSGMMQDYIEGPYDQTITTANFPVLSSIVGLAFGGASPFQAEVYFINTAGNIQIQWGIPEFDIFDPRFADFGVPTVARGTLTFHIANYREFIKLNRMIGFDLEDFKSQIKAGLVGKLKSVLIDTPTKNGIPAIQIERRIEDVGEIATEKVKSLMSDFGVALKRLDIEAIELDKNSTAYEGLKSITKDIILQTVEVQSNVNIKNLKDLQQINVDNLEDSLRIQREEAQRAQKLQTESTFINTRALELQTDILKTAAQNLGEMSSMNLGGGNTMNPAGMMTGMMMGGAMGNQMAGMMNQMENVMQQQQNTPPPPPQIQYYVAENGQSTGPFTWQLLQQMATNGQLTGNSYVWKSGMSEWQQATTVQELTSQFPPPPPIA